MLHHADFGRFQEDDAAGTWRIYVPEQITGGARGATKDFPSVLVTATVGGM